LILSNFSAALQIESVPTADRQRKNNLGIVVKNNTQVRDESYRLT
jgi:hypothetical protein